MSKLHEVLGSRSTRVKQFILEKKTGSDLDQIRVTLSRMTPVQFSAICKRLEQVEGVTEVKGEDEPTS